MFRDETAGRIPQADNSLGWPYSIFVADLNRDKRPDIAVSAFSSQNPTPAFYLNKGDGTFTPLPRLASATLPAAMFGLLDANRDGRLDIFSAVPSSFAQGVEHYALQADEASPVYQALVTRRPVPAGSSPSSSCGRSR
jgi:hypothetical protein